MATFQKVKLKDICERIDYGYTASANESNVGPKFLRITDIAHTSIDWDSVPYCKISETEKRKYSLNDGDIVVARTGATTGYAKCLKNPPEAVFASYLVRFRVNKENDNRFIGHVIESPIYKNFIKKNVSGSAQPQANAQVLGSYELSLPDKETQSRIASVLSTYDDLIENNEKRIKALEEMASRLYTEWFVKFKFPGHEKVKMVDSGTEFGMIPEGWEVKSLRDEIELGYGKALKKEDRIPGKILVCGSGGIVGTHNEKLVSGPGIVIGRKGNAGTVFWVNSEFYPIDTVFFVKTKLDLSFVFYLLKSQNFVLGDAAVPGLNRDQAYRNKVLIPDGVLIDGFSKKAGPIKKLIGQVAAENFSLSKTRDLLIPQLVTGIREVK